MKINLLTFQDKNHIESLKTTERSIGTCQYAIFYAFQLKTATGLQVFDEGLASSSKFFKALYYLLITPCD